MRRISDWLLPRVVPMFGALAFCVMSCALADTTTLTLADATKGTSKVPVTLPVSGRPHG